MVEQMIDRRYVSRYAEETLGVMVYRRGVLADADNDAVTARMLREDSTAVFDRPATRTGVGTYTVDLTADDTADPGRYTIEFTYTVDGVADTARIPIEVGSISPAYDALSPGWKQIVEQVWVRFADLFDSPVGGPHLQVYAQTNFGRNRIAQLLRKAVGRLNTVAQPHTTYSIEGNFPFDKWGALVEQALYVEVIKHLIRSYTEQPEVLLGTSISRYDRKDYQQRWQTVLDMEQQDLRDMMDNFKMDHMGLGRVSVLISGGAFGNYGPYATPAGGGAAAARGYYFTRRHF